MLYASVDCVPQPGQSNVTCEQQVLWTTFPILHREYVIIFAGLSKFCVCVLTCQLVFLHRSAAAGAEKSQCRKTLSVYSWRCLVT